MGEMLEENTTLEILNCGCTTLRQIIIQTVFKRMVGYEIGSALGNKGVRELSEGLEENDTLTILDLSGNEKEQSH